MLQENISRNVENSAGAFIRRKPNVLEAGAQKKKALSDVKNILHSHTSSAIDVAKSDDAKSIRHKKGKKSINISDGDRSGHLKSSNVKQHKFGSNVKIADLDCDTHNHLACVKANCSIDNEYLSQYRLTEKERDAYGGQMKFFTIDTLPFKLNEVTPAEEINTIEMKGRCLSDEEEVDFEIYVDVSEPEPLFNTQFDKCDIYCE